MPVVTKFKGAHKQPRTHISQVFTGSTGQGDPTPVDVTAEILALNHDGALEVAVPSAAENEGSIIIAQDVSGSAGTNNVTFTDVDGADINGDSGFILDVDYGRVQFIAINGDWYVSALSSVAGATPSLASLSDVDLSTPATDGQILKYSTSTSKWEPAADAT